MLMQLAINGILLALIPLAVVWASSDADKFRKLAWITVFLTFDLIMFGAFTRLTDSGLGCPDWPGCYGHANPLQAHAHIAAAEALLPSGPVTVAKAWIEMIHRYLATSVGVLIIALLVISWRRWRAGRASRPAAVPGLTAALQPDQAQQQSPLLQSSLLQPPLQHSPLLQPPLPQSPLPQSSLPPSPLLGAVILVIFCVQGAFGAWTVTFKLQPVIVTIHLLLAMLLLSTLAWLAAREGSQPAVAATARALRKPATLLLALLVMQIALGGWVSTNYAAMACTDFPLCQGTLLPAMDFQHSFTLWRQLGMTADGAYLPFEALTAIHWTHRMFAFVVAAAAVWLGCKAWKTAGLEKLGRGLLLAILLQFCTGIASVFLQWPLALAVLHSAGGALLVLILVMLNYRTRIVDHRTPAPETGSAALPTR
ncbi:MAG: COX15/CtaA family protein [Janthinobacterium lividum]